MSFSIISNIACVLTHIHSCSGLPSLVKRLPSLGQCQIWYWTVSGKCRQPASVVFFLKPSLHGLQWTMYCMFGMPAGAKLLYFLLGFADRIVSARWQCCRLSVPTKWQEEQAICCAGLTKPKPNVFQQAVHYILVVCTTVEVRPMQCLTQYSYDCSQLPVAHLSAATCS